MGLDITAYKKLTPAPTAEVDADGYPVQWDKYHLVSQHTLAITEENFPGRTEGLTAGVFDTEDTLGFRAGSYSGYNEWRRWLATLGGHESVDACWSGKITEGPFLELINFSDCEGVIGPVVSAKLAKDFEALQDKADTYAEDEEGNYFVQLYAKWRAAFEMAADGGCVDFH